MLTSSTVRVGQISLLMMPLLIKHTKSCLSSTTNFKVYLQAFPCMCFWITCLICAPHPPRSPSARSGAPCWACHWVGVHRRRHHWPNSHACWQGNQNATPYFVIVLAHCAARVHSDSNKSQSGQRVAESAWITKKKRHEENEGHCIISWMQVTCKFHYDIMDHRR